MQNNSKREPHPKRGRRNRLGQALLLQMRSPHHVKQDCKVWQGSSATPRANDWTTKIWKCLFSMTRFITRTLLANTRTPWKYIVSKHRSTIRQKESETWGHPCRRNYFYTPFWTCLNSFGTLRLVLSTWNPHWICLVSCLVPFCKRFLSVSGKLNKQPWPPNLSSRANPSQRSLRQSSSHRSMQAFVSLWWYSATSRFLSVGALSDFFWHL